MKDHETNSALCELLLVASGLQRYNISTYDFFDTYLSQYKLAFIAKPTGLHIFQAFVEWMSLSWLHTLCLGVMCSYNAENGHPSCANDFILNQQLRSWSPVAWLHGFSSEASVVECPSPSCTSIAKHIGKLSFEDAHVTTDCGAVGNLKGFPINAPDDEHAAAMALMNGTDLEMLGFVMLE